MRTADARGGSLGQIEGLPLMFSGDVVLVAARRFEDGSLSALPGMGVHFTDGERVTGTGTVIQSPLVGLSLADASKEFAGLVESASRP